MSSYIVFAANEGVIVSFEVVPIAYEGVCIALYCILIAYQCVVISLQQVFGAFDLIVISFQDFVLASENGVIQSKGFVKISEDVRVSPDQAVALAAYFIIVALQLIPGSFNHIVPIGSGFTGGQSCEKAIGGEQTAQLRFLFLGYIEGRSHAGEKIFREGGVAGDVDGFGGGECREEEKKSQQLAEQLLVDSHVGRFDKQNI